MPLTPLLPTLCVTAVLALSLTAWPAAHQTTPTTRTPDIHYVPTPTDVVEAMLKVAQVSSRDLVYDLGSGDGRIVIEAARRYGARGVGVELDSALVERARDAARKAGVEDKVSFVQGDLFTTDLSSATVVTLYLSPSINLRLRSKLERELRPGARIVSHRFPIGDWVPEQDLTVGSNHVLFWTIR